jgi:hypothetical protein
MVAQLQAAGLEVTVDADSYPNGRSARLHDPEGDPVEPGNLRIINATGSLTAA